MDSTRLTIGDDDPLRSYTSAEDQRIAENLRGAADEVYAGKYKDGQQDLALLCDLHARIFADVRDHGGRYRDRGRGSEHLIFGPHRSSHRDVVRQQLEQVFTELQRNMGLCTSSPDADNYEEACLTVAAKVHADLIRIHPFEDGNGRSTRLFMCSVLICLGLPPIELEVPRQEYIDCLNHYFRTQELHPLIDLCLRLYADALGP